MKPLSFARVLAGAIIGAFAGPLLLGVSPVSWLLGETFWLAILVGAGMGVVSIVLIDQARRLRVLEQRLVEMSGLETRPALDDSRVEAAKSQTPVSESTVSESPDSASADFDSPAVQPDAPTESLAEPVIAEAESLFEDWRNESRPAAPPLLGDFAERFGRINLPVKIGVLVLFIGLAAMLRYAADQGWLSMPIELRLAGIALLGIVGLWVGWQQREQRRVFALSLQGGAIGILVLTLFAAFRLYALVPQSVALVLAAILIFGGGVLAVVQRSQALAILMMIAGFAAPLLLSAEVDSPFGLFSWYAILNVAIFAVALKQHWPLLTRLGFIATFVIATLWGVLNWQPAHYWTAQAFLILFFLLYFLAPIVQARAAEGKPKLDVLLVFGLPLLAFPLQIALLVDNHLGIAFSALAAAVVYLIGARRLFNQTQGRLLAQAFAVLAVGLATLAIPFAFSGPTVVLVWALEGAALIWFGSISQRRFARIAGLLLIGLSAGIWLVLLVSEFRPTALLLLNASGLGGLAIAVAAWLAAWCYQRAGAPPSRPNVLFSFGFVFWLVMGVSEVERFFDNETIMTAAVGFCVLTVALTGLMHWRRGWSAAGLATVLMLALSALIVSVELYPENLLAHFGWAVWLAMLVVVLLLDRLLASTQSSSRSAWRTRISIAAHLTIVVFLTQQTWYWLWSAELASGWNWLLAGAPLLLLNGWMQTSLRPPLALAPVSADQRHQLTAAFMLLLVLLLVLSLSAAGDPAPLPWLPLLNPLELAQCFALLLIFMFVRLDAAIRLNTLWRLREWLPAVLAFLFITAAALRSVHQLADVAWNAELLFDSALAQATLTVVWTLLGVVAWVVGSKQHRPLLWRAGAVLLAVVLIKLLLIDRQYLSNVAGILSFVAFGLLSILVGFLAPAPPSADEQKSEPNQAARSGVGVEE